jgi:hydroxyacylglutathione hydrolase
MKIEQIYTGCLAQATYYIESEGEVAIIDPLRESQPYIAKAKSDSAQIKYIFETHFHADFVSGHLELAKSTGAQIIFGPNATTEFDFHSGSDKEQFKLGKITIELIHTPGHTMESSTYAIIDESGKYHALFTGDTLFLGDVGRPDLAVKTILTQEDLAKHLYHSLYTKLWNFPDSTIIYPGHGAGSACGKNMSKETVGTLGDQKKSNYALQNLSESDFVNQVTKGLTKPPQYFPKNVLLNKNGIPSIEEVIEQSHQALSPQEFSSLAESQKALILDVRPPQEFGISFVPQSINIGLNGQFASWVGTLITHLNQPILLVTHPEDENETITRLARIGYDNVIGFLEDGFGAWQNSGRESDKIHSISAKEFNKKFQKSELKVLDVRADNEYLSEHLLNKDESSVEQFSLDKIDIQMNKLQENKDYYIHCAGGYRSMIASSILKSRGYSKVININGGFKAIQEEKMTTSPFVCPSTL